MSFTSWIDMTGTAKHYNLVALAPYFSILGSLVVLTWSTWHCAAGSHQNSEFKQRRARLVLGMGDHTGI